MANFTASAVVNPVGGTTDWSVQGTPAEAARAEFEVLPYIGPVVTGNADHGGVVQGSGRVRFSGNVVYGHTLQAKVKVAETVLSFWVDGVLAAEVNIGMPYVGPGNGFPLVVDGTTCPGLSAAGLDGLVISISDPTIGTTVWHYNDTHTCVLGGKLYVTVDESYIGISDPIVTFTNNDVIAMSSLKKPDTTAFAKLPGLSLKLLDATKVKNGAAQTVWGFHVQSSTVTSTGVTTLGMLRTQVRERADMENSLFVTDAELDGYINASYYELYDLLVQKYGNDYFVAPSSNFICDGINNRFALPTDFYKLLGVDLIFSASPNGRIALKPFNFADRNRFIYPNVQVTFGIMSNLRYKLSGSNLWLIPVPASGQSIDIWYIPRLVALVNDYDVADGFSGWLEYVVVDAAIKCLQKEESDVSVLLVQKQALIKRIEAAAENRNAGAPATVVDNTRRGEGYGWGDMGEPQ